MISRNSNIEMLRILCMMSIIMGHFVSQTGFNNYSFDINSSVITVISMGARISVNVFLIISAWFLVSSRYRYEKITIIYTQLYLFSVSLTIISVIFCVDIGLTNIIRGFFPFFGRALWYASAYITLLIFLPYLNLIFLLSKKLQGWFVFCSLVLVSFISTMPISQNGYLIDSLWFLFVYIWIGYFKSFHYETLKRKIAKHYILFCGGGILIYLIMIFLFIISKQGLIGTKLSQIMFLLSNQYLLDFKTIPSFLCACLIFLGVVSCKPRKSEIINWISGAAFSAYLFHQVPAFYPLLWKIIFKYDIFANWSLSCIYVIFVGVVVYLISIPVHMLWKILFRILIEESFIYKKINEKLRYLYEGEFENVNTNN